MPDRPWLMRRSTPWLVGIVAALVGAGVTAYAGGRDSQGVALTASVEGLRVQGTSAAIITGVVAAGDVTATGAGPVGAGIGVIESITCSGYPRVTVGGTCSDVTAVMVVCCIKYARDANGAWKGEMAEIKTLTAIGASTDADYTEDSGYFTTLGHFDTTGYGIVKVVLVSVSAGTCSLRPRVN